MLFNNNQKFANWQTVKMGKFGYFCPFFGCFIAVSLFFNGFQKNGLLSRVGIITEQLRRKTVGAAIGRLHANIKNIIGTDFLFYPK